LTCPDTIFESDSLDLIEHDGFGGGEGEVILEDPQVAVSDFDGVVFVENFRHNILIPNYLFISIPTVYFDFNCIFLFEVCICIRSLY
jgi:hypothetical protein